MTAHRLFVFAVEDRSVQLTWSDLPAGPATFRAGSALVARTLGGGAGAVTIDGLEQDTTHEVTAEGPVVPGGRVSLEARTLPSPPGRELYRFATLNDLHIGSASWDVLGRMRERPEPTEIHTVRCARAALRELTGWGASRLLVKGDVTEGGTPDEWDTLGSLLSDVAIPIDMIPGNHDVPADHESVAPAVGARRAGIELIEAPTAVDVPGLRIILFDSAIPRRHGGRYDAADRASVLRLAAETDLPCLVATHHQPQRLRVATSWPPGVPGPEASRFLDDLAAANPRILLTSGHTHRHRRRRHGTVEITEVGSPRDYPGTWTGYVVHEGGIRQVVRRIESPEAIQWNERTRRGALGAWGHWSRGRLDDRCFTLRWH